MKTITSSDKGKRFYLDGDRSQEVTLGDLLPDDFASISYSDGRNVNVAIGRLNEIIEIPSLERVEDEVDFVYPQKAVRVTIEVYDTETGETIIQWLDGPDAVRWNMWMRKLCYKAEQVEMNPPWLSLKWRKRVKGT